MRLMIDALQLRKPPAVPVTTGKIRVGDLRFEGLGTATLERLTEQQANRLETILTWTAPSAAIPALRATQDPPELKLRLFVRDFSTAVLGGLVFLGASSGIEGWMASNAWMPHTPTRRLLAFGLGLTGNILYAGLGAPRLSAWIADKYHAGRASEIATEKAPQFAKGLTAASTTALAVNPKTPSPVFQAQTPFNLSIPYPAFQTVPGVAAYG
jgi:hypothetical protein